MDSYLWKKFQIGSHRCGIDKTSQANSLSVFLEKRKIPTEIGIDQGKPQGVRGR